MRLLNGMATLFGYVLFVLVFALLSGCEKNADQKRDQSVPTGDMQADWLPSVRNSEDCDVLQILNERLSTSKENKLPTEEEYNKRTKQLSYVLSATLFCDFDRNKEVLISSEELKERINIAEEYLDRADTTQYLANPKQEYRFTKTNPVTEVSVSMVYFLKDCPENGNHKKCYSFEKDYFEQQSVHEHRTTNVYRQSKFYNPQLPRVYPPGWGAHLRLIGILEKMGYIEIIQNNSDEIQFHIKKKSKFKIEKTDEESKNTYLYIVPVFKLYNIVFTAPRGAHSSSNRLPNLSGEACGYFVYFSAEIEPLSKVGKNYIADSSSTPAWFCWNGWESPRRLTAVTIGNLLGAERAKRKRVVE